MEVELMKAQDTIKKLQSDLADAEKKLTDSQREHLEKISALMDELQSSSMIKEKIQVLESENGHLMDELSGSKNEILDLQGHLETARQDHAGLQSQVDGFRERILNLEKELKETKDQVLDTRKEFSLQLESCQTELASKTETLEHSNKLYSELQLEYQEFRSKSQESEELVKQQIFNLEVMLKKADDEVKEKDASELSLQAEVVDLKSKLSEVSNDSEDRLKKMELEYQEQLRVNEETCTSLQMCISDLEQKISHLQSSLDVTTSDAEQARCKVTESEKGLEVLQQIKRELEEESADLRLQLKGMEDVTNRQLNDLKIAEQRVLDLEQELESLLHTKTKCEQHAADLKEQLDSLGVTACKQADCLKVAEEKADAANQQVAHLQEVLETTEKMLKASNEAVKTLQEEVSELKSKEAASLEYVKEIEKGSQELQQELESKLEASSATVSQLEGKLAELQGSLSDAMIDADSKKMKIRDLEAKVASLQHIQGELEEKLSASEEKCSQHENSAQTSQTRAVELEGLITEHRSKADDLNVKVSELEAALQESESLATDLEMQLKVAKENSLLFEGASASHISELENTCKHHETKIEELQSMVAEKESEIKNILDSFTEFKLSNKALEERLEKLQLEKNDLECFIQEYKSSVEKTATDLHEASVLEKNLRDEISSLHETVSHLQSSLVQFEEEKQTMITQLDCTKTSLAGLNDQFVREREELQKKIETITQENGDLEQNILDVQEKLHAAIAAAELSTKQLQESSSKESSLKAQIEELDLQLKNALGVCAHVESLEREKGSLAQEFTSAQEKIQAMSQDKESSFKQLQAALAKESELNDEIVSLKDQLEKARDAFSQVEKLEQTLKTMREEHQAQVDQLLSASRETESKLASVEGQLLASTFERKEAQAVSSERETVLKDLGSNATGYVEVVEQDSPAHLKKREIDLDLQSPGKAKNRKKKGVTWDNNSISKTEVVQKPQQHTTRIQNNYIAHILISVVSIMIGFWFARKLHS
ncbi:hypothetical protein KP509_04G021100 [Ceratopteris richardii]|nr:hypothetical protein KP509_04G021100 [Ceratopteris richardii]